MIMGAFRGSFRLVSEFLLRSYLTQFQLSTNSTHHRQCKHLKPEEQYKVARLILSVANNEPDANIAKAFRDLNIVTKNDSTKFLAKFGRLMFGEFKPEHLSHDWHKKLHSQDKVLYFPKELSMVYRTSLLLRGLAVSLQLNRSIGQEWKNHAQTAVDRLKDKIEL